MIFRFLAFFASTTLLAVMGLVVLHGIAAYDRTTLATTAELLKAGATTVEGALRQQARQMIGPIEAFAQEEGLATDLKTLTNVVNLVPSSGSVPERLRVRIEDLQDKLRERAALWRENVTAIAAVTFVDDSGVVLWSDSHFRQGDVLNMPAEDEEAEDEEAEDDFGDEGAAEDAQTLEGTEAPAETLAPDDFELTAMLGHTQTATLVVDQEVRWLTAAPISQKTRLAGALILETKLQALPPTPGAEAFVVVGDGITLGQAPEGFDGSNAVGDEPLLVAPAVAPAHVMGVELQVTPFYVDGERIGVWGQRFAVHGTTSAFGYVTADLSPFYAELAGFQLTALVLLILVWLVHAALILTSRHDLSGGVVKMADSLDRITCTGEQERLDELSYPEPLKRLAQLVNKMLGHSGVTPLPRAPSLDDVLEAQQVEAPNVEAQPIEVNQLRYQRLADLPRDDSSVDVSGLEFEGISGAGLLNVDSQAEEKQESAGDAQVEPPHQLEAEDLLEEEPFAEGSDDAGTVLETMELSPEDQRAFDDLEPSEIASFAEASGKAESGAEDQRHTGTSPPDRDSLRTAAGDDDEMLQTVDAEMLADDGGPANEGEKPAEPAPGALSWDAKPASGHSPASGPMAKGVALSKSPLKPPPAKEPELGDFLDEYASDATAVMELSPEFLAAMRRDAQKEAESDDSRAASGQKILVDRLARRASGTDAEPGEGENPREASPELQGRSSSEPPMAPGPPENAPASEVGPHAGPAAELPQPPATPVTEPTTRSPEAPASPSPQPQPKSGEKPDHEPAAPAAMSQSPVVDPTPLPETENAHFRAVYAEFLETRKSCGESVSDLTFDKFAAKLEKSRSAVMAKHNCSDVHFQVYVKNGKAALKAVPAR
jgi:hypothetical protein